MWWQASKVGFIVFECWMVTAVAKKKKVAHVVQLVKKSSIHVNSLNYKYNTMSVRLQAQKSILQALVVVVSFLKFYNVSVSSSYV